MDIVKLDKSHINQIHDLLFEQLGQEAWNVNQIENSFNSGSTFFYGMFDGDLLVCVASILVTVDDINLLDIATKENYKRQGKASTLLNYLISLKKPEQSFSLEVKSKNIPAIKLYKSVGFKALNMRKRYYKDGDDALCMFLN